MIDVEAEILFMCLVYRYLVWGMGLVFTCLSFDPTHVRQIRHNQVFSTENTILPQLLR